MNLFKDGLIRLLSRWRGAKNLPSSQRRFLLMATTGLGDTLWATPAIEALRKAFPESFIAVLTSPVGKEVLDQNPFIDRLYLIRNPALKDALSLWPELNRQRFDTVMVLHASQRPVFLLAGSIGASVRISTAQRNKGLDSLFTHLLPATPLHEIERRLDMVRTLAPIETDAKIHLFLDSKEEKEAEAILHSASLPVGIHPGSKDPFKRWPPNYFAEVGRALVAQGATVFITGGKDEQSLAAQIAEQIPGSINLAGKYPVRVLAALIKRFRLFLTNDTGPMHLAFASETPTVALFGPTDPRLCGPHRAKGSIILKAPIACRPCIGKRCPEPFCLLQITPSHVNTAMQELLL